MATLKITATQLFINGKYVPSISGKTFDTINPATQEKIASVSEAGPEDVDLAVKAARAAFDNGPWRKMSGSQRGRLLYKLAELIEAHATEFGVMESTDNGMVISFSTMLIYLSVLCLKYYAGWADKVHGQQIPIEGPFLCYTRHEPVGEGSSTL